MVTKDIAVLYWKLPQNADPKSVLVLFFSPDGRADDIWESDLHPENTIYGLRSSCPTLAAAYSRKTGVMRYLHPSILDCYDDPPTPDEEIYLLNLRGGWISANATDFLMPAFPIQMQREYYSWNPKGNAGF